jgi:hypothetical protein
MLALGRGIGLGASAITITLWNLFLFGNPYSTQGITAATHSVAYLMMFVALVGGLAAWKARPYLMLLVFALSFIPMGLYLLGTPGTFLWIGVANLGFLASGILLRSGRKAWEAEL